MRTSLPTRHACLVAFACIAMVAPFARLNAQPAPPATAVTVSDNGTSWTLDNGIIKATVAKDTGSMPSLLYRGMEMLKASGGTWEHNPLGAPSVTNRITIDPATTGGARAEV